MFSSIYRDLLFLSVLNILFIINVPPDVLEPSLILSLIYQVIIAIYSFIRGKSQDKIFLTTSTVFWITGFIIVLVFQLNGGLLFLLQMFYLGATAGIASNLQNLLDPPWAFIILQPLPLLVTFIFYFLGRRCRRGQQEKGTAKISSNKSVQLEDIRDRLALNDTISEMLTKTAVVMVAFFLIFVLAYTYQSQTDPVSKAYQDADTVGNVSKGNFESIIIERMQEDIIEQTSVMSSQFAKILRLLSEADTSEEVNYLKGRVYGFNVYLGHFFDETQDNLEDIYSDITGSGIHEEEVQVSFGRLQEEIFMYLEDIETDILAKDDLAGLKQLRSDFALLADKSEELDDKCKHDMFDNEDSLNQCIKCMNEMEELFSDLYHKYHKDN